jgi:MGT family glycosyltransferase
VFLGFPGHGHVNPTIGVVKELISRGEKVYYYCTPEFKPKIKSTGADFGDYRISLSERKDFLERLFRGTIDLKAFNQLGQEAILRLNFYFKVMKNQKRNLLKILAEIKPDYIIHDSCAHWGKTLSKQLGVPAIASTTTFAYCGRILELHPDFVIQNIMRLPAHYSNNHREIKIVIERISKRIQAMFDIPDFDYFDILCSHEEFNIVYTSKEFQYFSELFDQNYSFVGPSLNFRKDSRGFPMEKLAEKDLIYISLGTVSNDNSYHFNVYRNCLTAFGNTGKQVLLSIGNANPFKLGTIPQNFMVRKSVPQLDILKRTALFITHGGMNSVNEALYHNVPMIVVPQRVDQFQVADRVSELGVGIQIKNEEISAEALSEAANRIFSDKSYRERAGIIGKTLRETGGSKQAADEILQFKLRNGIN